MHDTENAEPKAGVDPAEIQDAVRRARIDARDPQRATAAVVVTGDAVERVAGRGSNDQPVE